MRSGLADSWSPSPASGRERRSLFVKDVFRGVGPPIVCWLLWTDNSWFLDDWQQFIKRGLFCGNGQTIHPAAYWSYIPCFCANHATVIGWWMNATFSQCFCTVTSIHVARLSEKKTKKNMKDVGGRERKIPIAKNYVHKKSRLCRESFSCHPCPFPLNVATSSIENASNSFPKRFFQTNKCLISFFVIKGPYRDGQGVGDISTSLDFVPTDWQCKNHLKHFPLSTWRVMIQLSFGQVSAH